MSPTARRELRAYSSKRARHTEALAWGKALGLVVLIAVTVILLVLAGLSTI